jgi:hypothetical protein
VIDDAEMFNSTSSQNLQNDTAQSSDAENTDFRTLQMPLLLNGQKTDISLHQGIVSNAPFVTELGHRLPPLTNRCIKNIRRSQLGVLEKLYSATSYRFATTFPSILHKSF